MGWYRYEHCVLRVLCVFVCVVSYVICIVRLCVCTAPAPPRRGTRRPSPFAADAPPPRAHGEPD